MDILKREMELLSNGVLIEIFRFPNLPSSRENSFDYDKRLNIVVCKRGKIVWKQTQKHVWMAHNVSPSP